jgi:ferredoxin
MEQFSVLSGRSCCGIAATPSSVVAVRGSRVPNRKPNFVNSCCNGFVRGIGESRKRIVTARAHNDESLNWMGKGKSPYSVLGISPDCSEEDIKDAFRNRIKEFHPDVYKGTEDADAITQRIIRAYEILTNETVERVSVERMYRRNNLDPFEVPECEAEDVFVFEMNCIGRGCPYACVDRAPDVFKFAADTGCARAVSQRGPGQGEDYGVQLAVGQCPRNCIYWVTPMQREVLENFMARAAEGTTYSSELVTLETLIARANYENGRYQPPKQKRQPTSTDQWVDWF